MKRKKIFISSTYTDLIPHRRAIWKLLQSFNVDVSGMERFGARSESPLETCLTEVEESDIFVGVIGMRYGSIESTSKKSYSQLEYEKAVQKKLIILFYLIDEERSEIIPKFIDFENIVQLRKFKSIISRKHTVEKYFNEKSLIDKLNLDLRNILPDSSIIKNYRPEKIEGKVYRFNLKKEKWLVVLGLKFGEPFELYAGKDEDGLSIIESKYDLVIPKVVDSDGNERFDIQFKQEDGFRITIEGLSRPNSLSFISLTSTLLKNEIPLKTAIEILRNVDLNLSKIELLLKKEVLRILAKQI